jgi:hypothetical protein
MTKNQHGAPHLKQWLLMTIWDMLKGTVSDHLSPAKLDLLGPALQVTLSHVKELLGAKQARDGKRDQKKAKAKCG